MKNKIFSTLALVAILGGVGFLSSCGSDDESFAVPTIMLSENTTTASPGEEISVTVTATTDATFESIVVTKLWDGESQGANTISDLPEDSFTYSYLVTNDDAEHILSFNFLITDAEGKTATIDWVVTVELTIEQLLLKYNWRHSSDVRKSSSVDHTPSGQDDDILQFNADGTFLKSHGATKTENGFEDFLTYCSWALSEESDTLFVYQVDWVGVDNIDTIRISEITESSLVGDIKLRGLDQFPNQPDPPFGAVEEFVRTYVAVAKTDSFDPYNPGNDDDAGPNPDGICNSEWHSN